MLMTDVGQDSPYRPRSIHVESGAKQSKSARTSAYRPKLTVAGAAPEQPLIAEAVEQVPKTRIFETMFQK